MRDDDKRDRDEEDAGAPSDESLDELLDEDEDEDEDLVDDLLDEERAWE